MLASGHLPKTAFDRPGRKHALAACVLSLLMPGLGQAYNGELGKAAAWGLPLPLTILLLFPGKIFSSFAGLVLWGAAQLCLSLVTSVIAYRSGFRGGTANGTVDLSWRRRLVYVLVTGVCIGALNEHNTDSTTIKAFTVTVDSMAPTMKKGDRVFADLSYYSRHEMQRGDVAIFQGPERSTWMKRLAGLGGDVVEGKNGEVFVNGELFDRNHRIDPQQSGTLPEWIVNFGPITVPDGKAFVIGDNRAASIDSRFQDFGLRDQSSIEGKVLYIYWSPDHSRIGEKVR